METIQNIADKMNRHIARRERVDLKAIYAQLKGQYPLVLTETFSLENGEKDFGENLEILLGESAAGKFQLYDNGLDIVFEVDRPDGSHTHWHPGNTAEAMADVAAFMEGKRKHE